eukprot:363460_1
MSTSRKRKDDPSDESQPPIKKQRVTLARTFVNHFDEQQYLSIHNTLIQTQLILNTSTPLAISQLISQYSTGTLSTCFYCHEIINYLKGDTFENDIFRISEGLVCKQCKEKHTNCKSCGVNYKLFNCCLCDYCKTPLCSNTSNCENNNECNSCLDRICDSCSVQCVKCASNLCQSFCSVDCEYGHTRCENVNCAAECYRCQEEVCVECVRDGYICNTCRSIHCGDCLVHCNTCDATTCLDCLHDNQDCEECNAAENDEINDVDEIEAEGDYY